MMKRKTVDVLWLKAFANNMLEGSDPSQKEVRLGVSVVLEAALMESGNYKGFRYLGLGEPGFDATRRMYF